MGKYFQAHVLYCPQSEPQDPGYRILVQIVWLIVLEILGWPPGNVDSDREEHRQYIQGVEEDCISCKLPWYQGNAPGPGTCLRE